MGWGNFLSDLATSISQNNGALTLVSTAVTALATAALFYATWVLARETKVLSKAAAQPHVTVGIEPNQWALVYFDLVVRNSGNAPAYDIKIAFDPPIPDPTDFRKGMAVPLSSISMLTPSHELRSALSDYQAIKGSVFKVTVSWRLRPKSKRRETLVYDLAITDYDDVTQLGSSSPFVQMADQLKKLREDWRYVASGSRKVSVNSYTSADRAAERAILDKRFGRSPQPLAQGESNSVSTGAEKPAPRKRAPKKAVGKTDQSIVKSANVEKP